VIYLSGGLSPAHLEGEGRDDLGFMLTFPKANRGDQSGRAFAFDNGCFSRPDLYSDDTYLRWLDTRNRDGCLFATAPDVVGDWVRTIERSYAVLPRIRDLGFPAAFIAQDGIPPAWIAWGEFDVLFVGGSTTWKLSEDAFALPKLAHAHGKKIHLGRVNSEIRYRAARAAGYDSADGTMLAYGRTVNWERVRGWLDDAVRQPALGLLRVA
jgi:hypothetical protein